MLNFFFNFGPIFQNWLFFENDLFQQETMTSIIWFPKDGNRGECDVRQKIFSEINTNFFISETK